MAKKYLLYIHDERFANEEGKSKLVNELLAQHYETEPKKEYIEYKAKFDVMPDPFPINKNSKDYSLCPHSQVKGFCKKGCK